MRVSNLTTRIGAEIDGIDLNKTLGETEIGDLYDLLLDRAVLVFRNQDLSPQAHLALGAQFGPLAERHPLFPHVDGHDQIMVIRNDPQTPPENEVWHSDISFKPSPPFASLLYGKIIPPAGGDTMWADMRSVHDSLSEPLLAMLRGMEAQHSLHQGFEYLRGSPHADRLETLNRTDRASNTMRHPVVKRHPASKRDLIYVNESFTESIVGLTKPESDGILRLLFEATRNPIHQLRVRWQEGTLVMWDNWATQHYAVADHWPQEREVQRVTVMADGRSRGFTETIKTAA